jgi:hypothetical protein
MLKPEKKKERRKITFLTNELKCGGLPTVYI